MAAQDVESYNSCYPFSVFDEAGAEVPMAATVDAQVEALRPGGRQFLAVNLWQGAGLPAVARVDLRPGLPPRGRHLITSHANGCLYILRLAAIPLKEDTAP